MVHPSTWSLAFLHVGYRTPDGRPILSDLTLEVTPGETLVLLGQSGSGKTTTLRLVNRLIEPTTGDVHVNGRSIFHWDPIQLRRRIGYVIQEVGLLPHYTVARNIGLVPELEGWPPAVIRSRVEELLHLVGLDPATFRDRYPHQLSGGQRQRVGVARALAADPPVLLMDEPFGALDPLTRLELQREFHQLEQRLKKTVLFVTHDLTEALRLADRIALLDAGQLVGVYSPAEFLQADAGLAARYREAFLADAAWRAQQQEAP